VAHDGFFEQLHNACGGQLTVGDDINPRYLRDFLNQREGRALAVVRPRTTTEVAAIVRLCHNTQTPVVPQGGNTGYRAGATPDDSGHAVVLSLENMNAVRDINSAASSITVEAGCILANVQRVAEEAGLFFSLQLGAAGSCHIGGNLATNAGGLNVLRYGSARELCLGVEAVLPSGEVMNLLSSLRKDNTGYDLKNLLIGSEGTLGVITAATLKLFPRLVDRATAYAIVPDVKAALKVLDLCQKITGGHVESFELMPEILFKLLQKNMPDVPLPFSVLPPLAVLVEVAAEESASLSLQEALAEALACGLITDAALASSEAQRQQFWAVRELSPEATKREGSWSKLDVSLPADNLADFIDAVNHLIVDDVAGQYIVAFGHAGDGNLHLSLRPRGQAPEKNPALVAMLEEQILDAVYERGGSFSAEHGIGQTKLAAMKRYKNTTALTAMRAIKKALDPNNIMNPGKMIDVTSN
jgi:FAD/FMN-containing dehydrogenase